MKDLARTASLESVPPGSEYLLCLGSEINFDFTMVIIWRNNRHIHFNFKNFLTTFFDLGPSFLIPHFFGGHPVDTCQYQIGDRIVEVEGENVSLENHGQVVSRIAKAGLRLSLLVVDSECEEFHRQRNIVITSTLPHTVGYMI